MNPLGIMSVTRIRRAAAPPSLAMRIRKRAVPPARTLAGPRLVTRRRGRGFGAPAVTTAGAGVGATTGATGAGATGAGASGVTGGTTTGGASGVAEASRPEAS